jgi:diguanylate cyclase (GGDEF)-like protein/PAS domain S-box-containing protein
MAAFLVAHSVLALVLASAHQTWRIAGVVVALAAGGFLLCAACWPGRFATRVAAGLALQAFCALHIHQMRGLAEMHFFYFTATTAMIIYQDWRAMWPGVLAIVAQHIAFSVLHNASAHPGGHPFFEAERVGTLKLGFHFGIALVQAVVASYWAELLRRRTIAAAAAHQELRSQTRAFAQQVQATQAGEARLQALTAASPVGVFHSDAEGRLTYVNAHGQQLWGRTEAELLGRGWLGAVHPEDRNALDRAWIAALAAGCDYEHEYRVVRPNGSTCMVHARAASLRDEAGRVLGSVGTVEDVTERRQAAHLLAESERRFRTVVESVDHGLLITDREDRILYANARAEAITGYPAGELVGRVGVEVLVPEEQRAAFHVRMANRLRGETERYELALVRRDGTQVWTENSGVPFRDGSGEIVGTIGVITDITARRALEAELTRQAFEDSLTGLANRVRLRARIEHALTHAEAGHQPAVLLVDLDDFKHINDSLGHAAGDQLLAVVAERLLDATRGSDTVARLGGDEFAVLLGGVCGAEEATLVAGRVTRALQTPFSLDGREVRVGASVGIALAAVGDTSDHLLRNADLALYQAKAHGKGGHALFAAEMHAAAVERLELEGELRRALEEHQLVLHYQPIVDLASRATVGVEALVRWWHPERGLLSPAVFIPLAEATGLIVPLGRWVLTEACRTVAACNAERAHGAAPLSVSVNVSGRQLQDAGLLEDVTAALQLSGLLAAQLVLEVTESMLLENLEAALGRLEALRALGVRVSLDDFGTGYSSLAYLQRLPVDVLKIDRAFTSQVAAGGRSAAFARAVLTFASALGMRTVAEGVETAQQHDELRALGCGFGQGFLYARPLEPEALTAYLREQPAPHVATLGRALPPDAPAAHARRGSTILVVDDEPAIRRMVRRMLQPRGFVVLEAQDGADALRQLAAHRDRVDLVLTDLEMPELGGRSLAHALRISHGAERRPPPVLFMSGLPMDGLLLPDLASGGASLLSKPFSAEQLLERVRAALEAHQATSHGAVYTSVYGVAADFTAA